jgi:hypothetical protein
VAAEGGSQFTRFGRENEKVNSNRNQPYKSFNTDACCAGADHLEKLCVFSGGYCLQTFSRIGFKVVMFELNNYA